MPPRQSTRPSLDSPEAEIRVAFEMPNVPPRDFRPMHAEAIIAWTPSRLLRALTLWLLEEDRLWRDG